METCANIVLQFFGLIILPLMLPIFVFSILTGMRSEKLSAELFSTMQSILEIFIKAAFAVLKLLLKGLDSWLTGISKQAVIRSPNRKTPENKNYPKKSS